MLMKKMTATNYSSLEEYRAQVWSMSNYYPFGMVQPGRNWNDANGDYRYGYNGKEKDDEIKGEANSLDYGFRIYDPRVGKFLSVDPLFRDFPWNSTYAFAENRPIDGVDLEGLEYVSAVKWARSQIADYTIPFMLSSADPPTFKSLKKSTWRDVINGSMYCATSTALSYAQANPKVAQYLSKNGYETNRLSGQFEFFQKGGKHHSLISASKFNEASAGDLLFLQSTTAKGPMSGHVAILAGAPIAKGSSLLNSNVNKAIPEGGYFIEMLTTNAGSRTTADGSTTKNTFGLAGYIIEQRADKGYYLKGKIVASVEVDKDGKTTQHYFYKDMSADNLKVQGFGRVDESKIENTSNKDKKER